MDVIRSAASAPQVPFDYDGEHCGHHGCIRPGHERLLTGATVITFVRTVVSAAVMLLAAHDQNMAMLLVGLGLYWAGDILDGFVARSTDTETRWGAILDIVSDRFCAATYYIGFVWLVPHMWWPVGIFLFEFMVVDAVLSLAFLAWPLTSPNYFYLVDRRIWTWNWSKPGKAVNSAAVAILLELTRSVWVGAAIAIALLALKIVSFVWLAKLGLPMPKGCAAGDPATVSGGIPQTAPPLDASSPGTAKPAEPSAPSGTARPAGVAHAPSSARLTDRRRQRAPVGDP